MSNCVHCQHELIPGAKFCSNCGKAVAQAVLVCVFCEAANLPNAVDCQRCGQAFKLAKEENYTIKYPLDFRETGTLEQQIRAQFFKEFQQVVEAEINRHAYRKYFDLFYKSGFYKKFDIRTRQLVEEVYSIHRRQNERVNRDIDQLLSHSFRAFIDHFIIVYGESLHQMKLPQAILRYQDAKLESINLRQMIFDYLDFEWETETIYTDFIKMSTTKLKNASQSFLFPKQTEKIFFICDQTVFGSCKEGFAMTEDGLYWKSHFNPPQQIQYSELEDIRRESEWLSIDGKFFNVSKSMNVKMLKLLKKIKHIMQ